MNIGLVPSPQGERVAWSALLRRRILCRG